MMIKSISSICLLLCLSLPLEAQHHRISLLLLDDHTQEAIPGAHVFIENSTFGTFSNENGIAEFQLPSSIKGDLIVSHIGYSIEAFEATRFDDFTDKKTIYLSPASSNLPQAVITAKRDKKWKRRYKKFISAFLGKDNIAKQCVIQNPSVLNFYEEEGKLIAQASDLIHIQNSYLGYDIYYLLTGFEMTKDGSVKYAGRARFVDSSTPSSFEKIQANRNKLYLSSPKHFFKSLIDDKLSENGYRVQMVDYIGGNFKRISDFDRNLHFDGPSQTNKYTVSFDAFLEVYNVNSKSIELADQSTRIGGLESQRFNASTQEKKQTITFLKSQLYKIVPYIILDDNGNILNTKHVKEYGFWAEKKMAQQLPFDYGNIYKKDKENNIPVELKQESLLKHPSQDESFQWFYTLLYDTDPGKKNRILENINTEWRDGFTAPLIELIRLSSDKLLVNSINKLLDQKFNQKNSDYFEWLQWLWQQGFEEETFYFKFKSELYKNIDPKFYSYFKDRKSKSTIRLDEIVWGGVKQDGIPPLRNPKLLSVKEASYLNDNDIVFGVFINGIAKAYPKRILAWHEFFTDDFGGLNIAGVYCTLCGTVIAYDMNHKGTFHDLGTSGFLYRSNKLMYDKGTQSLWSTINGVPVVGPLVNKDIELHTYPVVTTDWQTWRERHPDTKVLSFETGYDRDYGKGVAYKDYFATDNLMFPVPKLDKRLKNKDEVFIIRAGNFKTDPIAIAVDYLKKNKWYQDTINDLNFIAISDASGAIRAYDAEDIRFTSYKKNKLIDHEGQLWSISDDGLTGPDGDTLKRLPAHNIFWFAWYNVYPNTRLVR